MRKSRLLRNVGVAVDEWVGTMEISSISGSRQNIHCIGRVKADDKEGLVESFTSAAATRFSHQTPELSGLLWMQIAIGTKEICCSNRVACVDLIMTIYYHVINMKWYLSRDNQKMITWFLLPLERLVYKAIRGLKLHRRCILLILFALILTSQSTLS